MSTEIQTSERITEKHVFEALEQLERTVYVPVVSGEVGSWLEATTVAIGRVEEIVCAYFRQVHPDLFEQIASQDPELNARVQSLEQEDGEICTCMRSLADLAKKLTGAGEHVEPDERLIGNALKELSDRVVGLVQRIRKHETEISTWQTEAMVRDRGSVD